MADKTVIIMPEDHPEWFNTPVLQYLSMKKELLGKFEKSENFGEFGTEKQVIALSCLLEYFRMTRDLADQFPHLSNDITVENKNLLVKRVITLPNKHVLNFSRQSLL